VGYQQLPERHFILLSPWDTIYIWGGGGGGAADTETGHFRIQYRGLSVPY
jgi:hypothetical protein